MSRRLVDGKKPEKNPNADQGGRPTELNPELIKNITTAIRLGNFPSVACAMYGIHRQRIREWVAKGRENPGSIYAAFADMLHKAIAEAEIRDLATIDAYANGRPAQYERDKEGNLILDADGKPILLREEIRPQWQAAAWKLERRSPKRWGRFDRVHMTVENEMEEIDVTPQNHEEKVTPEEKESKLRDVLSKVEALRELGDDDDDVV